MYDSYFHSYRLLLMLMPMLLVAGVLVQAEEEKGSSRQFLLVNTFGCDSATVRTQVSHRLPPDVTSLQYQALHEHLISASTSDYLLIGARNLALNVSIYPRLEVSDATIWFTSQSEDDGYLCDRLVRTYLPTNAQNNEWLICDSNMEQECRRISNSTVSEDTLSAFTRLSNEGRAAAHYSAETNRLYFAGSVDGYAQFELAPAADISHEHRVSVADYIDTELSLVSRFFDVAAFNFHSIQESQDKLYLLFEEAAAESTYLFRSERPERRVARVAEICKGEPGFMPQRDIYPLLSTFRKIRLSCRMGGSVYESGVDYDSFVGGTRFGKLTLRNGSEIEVFYAAFNYANEYVQRAAVCAYDVASMRRIFNEHHEHFVFGSGGLFKPLRTVFSDSSMNTSQCSAPQSNTTVDFIRSHPLLTAVLNPIGWKPIFITATDAERLITSINVDWQVKAADSNIYNVLYLGTDAGKVLKVTVDSLTSYGYSEIDAADGEAILTMHLAGATHAERVVSITNSTIVSSSASTCEWHTTCEACVAARDAYCSWFEDACRRSDNGLVDIQHGNVSVCPIRSEIHVVESIILPVTDEVGASQSSSSQFDAQPMALRVAEEEPSGFAVSLFLFFIVVLVAALVGLIVGYMFGVRAGFKPFCGRFADRVHLLLRNRVRYSPVIVSLSGRVQQTLLRRGGSMNRCDSKIEQTKPSVSIDFCDDAPKLNDLSNSHDTNLYATSTKPVINIYESVYENGVEDCPPVDEDEEEAAHYADVIQSGSDSRASIALVDDSGEHANSYFDKIVIDNGNRRLDAYAGVRATYTANRSESSQTKSSNGTDGCTSPDVNDFDGCLQVPIVAVNSNSNSNRPSGKNVPNLLSRKLKGLLLDRFTSKPGNNETGSNYATSSSNNSAVL